MDVIILGPFPKDATRIKGGVQASVYGLAIALSRHADIGKVHAISVPMQDDLVGDHVVPDGIKVTYLPIAWRFQASAVVYVPRILREAQLLQNPAFHIHSTGFLQAALGLWLKLKGVPFVWTMHGITEKETFTAFLRKRSFGGFLRFVSYRQLERLLERIATKIIVDTSYVATELRRRHGIVILPQGIFPSEFHAIGSSLRRGNTILSIGVIDPRKGYEILLEAFVLVLARVPGARLQIAGALFFPDYYSRLKQRAEELAITAAVSFHTELERRQLITLLTAADIFALASEEESQGIAICEAMAAGLPIVATNVGGIPNVVRDGEDSVLVPYGDPIRLAEALSLLLENPERRRQMGEAALINSERFDWATIASRAVAIYKSVEPALA